MDIYRLHSLNQYFCGDTCVIPSLFHIITANGAFFQ